MTQTQAPCFVTTVDQHRGDHGTGMRMMELVEVRTAFTDHSQEKWDSLDDDARQWWEETLADLHAAEVELANLDSDHRRAAREEIDRMYRSGVCDDLEYAAGAIRRAIEETNPDATA